MACFVPLKSSNNSLEISLFALRPTVVMVDDVVEGLKHFSLWSKSSVDCVCSSIFKSLHGNMIVWYGAWTKRSDEDKEMLHAAMVSRLTNTMSGMAILVEHMFLEAYAGESRDSLIAAKLSVGDTISLSVGFPMTHNLDDVSYACLALFKSHFVEIKGIKAGVCLKCQLKPCVLCLLVWKSLNSCYSWILNFSLKNTVLPYLDRYPLDIKYDVFRVVYVYGDNAQRFRYFASRYVLENGEECREGQVIQDVNE